LIRRDVEHSVLYRIFLDVHNAAGKILEHTTLANIPAGANSGEMTKSENRTRTKIFRKVIHEKNQHVIR
jgi:hypothetical protein